MAKKKRQPGLRRRVPWLVRLGLWTGILTAIAVAGIFLVFRGGGGGDEGGISRFPPVHQFDTADFHSLAFSPGREGVVLYGHHNGLQMSEDDGQSWTKVVDQRNWDAMNLVYDPFSPDTVYVAGHNVYYRSEDGGETWAEVSTNLPGLDLHAFAASPSEQGRFYAFAVGYGLYISDDEGRQWRLLSSAAPPGTSAVLELPDGTLLLAAPDTGILRSEDGGKTWTTSREGIDTGVTFTVKSDPGGRRLYAGTNHGLFVSTDGGKAWSATSLNDTTALVVGVNPSDPQEVMVVNLGGELFRSGDGGLSW